MTTQLRKKRHSGFRLTDYHVDDLSAAPNFIFFSFGTTTGSAYILNAPIMFETDVEKAQLIKKLDGLKREPSIECPTSDQARLYLKQLMND